MTDLLLVNPSAKAETYGELSQFSAFEPPLWCALLAAYVRERGHSVAILDAEAEGLGAEDTAKRIAEQDPLVAAIIVLGSNPSVSSTPKMTAVTRMVKELRKLSPLTRIALGGLHPSALPEKTLRETKAKFVCQGEGFRSLSELVDRLKFSTYLIAPGLWYREGDVTTYGGKADLIDPNEIPMAAWDLLPMERYRAHNWQCLGSDKRSPYAMVYTSLGCPFNCQFCNIHAMYGGKPGIRYRNPEKVAEEIDHLVRAYGVHIFKFMDEMFALKRSHVLEVCDQIAALGHDLNIWCYGRVDTVDMEMLRAMRRAGMRWICFGFESASEIARMSVGKKYATAEIERVREMCRRADINIIANFMVGLPDDDMETMRETMDKAKELNFEYLNLYCCAAYPGSQLYERAVREGTRLPKRWADYSQFSPKFIPLPTKYVSAQEVLRFRDSAFEEYFGRPEYLNMVEGKFGVRAREHIEGMLRVKIRRET